MNSLKAAKRISVLGDLHARYATTTPKELKTEARTESMNMLDLGPSSSSKSCKEVLKTSPALSSIRAHGRLAPSTSNTAATIDQPNVKAATPLVVPFIGVIVSSVSSSSSLLPPPRAKLPTPMPPPEGPTGVVLSRLASRNTQAQDNTAAAPRLPARSPVTGRRHVHGSSKCDPAVSA